MTNDRTTIIPYRSTSPALRADIEAVEGRRYKTYKDVKGVATAGVGHTGRDVILGATYTDAQIELWLTQDILEAVATVYRYIAREVIDAIPAPSWDALISFVFNVGAQAFRDPKTGKPTNFAKTLNASQFDQVDDRMQDWDKATINGVLTRVNGLTLRRASEAARWNAGFAPASAPVPPVPVPETHAVEQSTAVPDAPPKPAAVSTATVVGAVTTAAGAVASIAPDALVQSGKQLRELSDAIPFLGVIGAAVIALGIGLMLYRDIARHRNAGA